MQFEGNMKEKCYMKTNYICNTMTSSAAKDDCVVWVKAPQMLLNALCGEMFRHLQTDWFFCLSSVDFHGVFSINIENINITIN